MSNAKKLNTLLVSLTAMVGMGISVLAIAAEHKDPNNLIYQNADLYAAMQRDLNMTEEQLPKFVDAEKQATAIEAAAKTRFGDSYAGTWIEQDASGNFKHIVATSGKSTASFNKNMEVVEFSLSMSQLDATMEKLNNTMTAMREAPALARSINGGNLSVIHSWFVDVKANSVVITVAPQAIKDGIEFAALSGVDSKAIQVQASEGEPMNALNVYGGIRYGSGGGSCSIGFPITKGSTKGFATAGHCGTAGTSVSISSTTVGSVQSSSFPTNDRAWATVRSSDSVIGLVSQYNGYGVAVSGSSEAAVGAAVCRSGYASGYRCGYITSKNVTVNYSVGPVNGLTQANACLTQGDSGGSWITTAGQAQGVSSGGQLAAGPSPQSNCTLSSPVSYFQKINPLLSAYGLSLVLY